MIKPSITDSYAEYLHIQIMRSTNDAEVIKLRKELEEVRAALYTRHNELVQGKK